MMDKHSMPLPQVVEAIGVGPAQLLILVLGPGGVFFVEGIGLTAFTSMVTAVTSEMSLATSEKGLLSSMAFVGLFFGVLTSGYLAETCGRRLPTIMCYAVITVTLIACSIAPTWTSIVFSGTLTGFGMGLGMPASIAMLSEVLPVQSRLPARAATAMMFATGVIILWLMVAEDDPTLANLHWRHFLRVAAVFPMVFFVCSTIFLPESPIFLAMSGQRALAQAAFRRFGIRNGNTVSGEYELPAEAVQPDGEKKQTSAATHLQVMASRDFWYASIVNTWASFCTNLVLFGSIYAGPQVAAAASTLPAAYQSMVNTSSMIPALVGAGILMNKVTRRTSAMTAFSICISGLLATSIAGSRPLPRSIFFDGLFQYGSLSVGAGCQLAFVVIFQVAVEIYPASSSAFAASVIIGLGRVGGMIAPELFDYMWAVTGNWQSYYYFLAACCGVSVVLLAFAPDSCGRLENDDHKIGFGTSYAPDYSTMQNEKP